MIAAPGGDRPPWGGQPCCRTGPSRTDGRDPTARTTPASTTRPEQRVPVFPAVSFGLTPYFLAYPGTVSLRVETYVRLIRDILDSLAGSGFRRILIVNGHGGNQPARPAALEWMADHPGIRIRFHNWWNAPKTLAKVEEIDPVASHASWMENFPWTRLAGVEQPAAQKPMIDLARTRLLDPVALRAYLGDGNFGGFYQRPDDDMLAIWAVAVAETRELLEGPWQ